jgi:hypothetical protein
MVSGIIVLQVFGTFIDLDTSRLIFLTPFREHGVGDYNILAAIRLPNFVILSLDQNSFLLIDHGKSSYIWQVDTRKDYTRAVRNT